MRSAYLTLIALMAITACSQAPTPPAAGPQDPIDAAAPPTPERIVGDPLTISPANPDAQSATGALTFHDEIEQPPTDPTTGEIVGAARTYLFLEAANGVTIDAELIGGVDATVPIGGDPIAAIADPPADISLDLYLVSNETLPPNGVGLCGVKPVTHLAIASDFSNDFAGWRILAISGAAPGELGAVLCQRLDYVTGR